MGYFGLQFADNAILANATVTTAIPGPTITTTGYPAITIQIANATSSNLWSGLVVIEGSNDGVNWNNLLVNKINELSVQTQIDTVGIYVVRCDTIYIRYNVQQTINGCTIIMNGNSVDGSMAIDKLSLAMDENNNSPLNVKLQAQNSGIKQDLSGAFILSDAPQPVTVNQVIGSITTIDTQGYQSIQITTNSTFAAGLGVQYSNDGVTFIASTPMLTGAGIVNTGLAASQTYVSPCYGRFARIVSTAAGSFTYVLRNYSSLTAQNLAGISGASVNPATAQLGINIATVGGTATVTGGVAGTLGVGGTNAVGIASASNPVLVGGVDPTGLARRATSTMLGDLITSNRTIPTNLTALGTTTTGNAPIGAAGYNNQVPQTIQDTSQFEGQTQTELLAQILQEMKIMNQQIYQLPQVQQAAFNGSTTAVYAAIAQLGDEPTQMRNDSSIFFQQQ
jgi:hypothetical protein